MAKVDLSKLKDEIDNRKNGKMITSGYGAGNKVAPRDEFLYGLMESLKSGKETSSSALVKTVENKVASKRGESRLPISDLVSPQQYQVQRQAPQRINEEDMSPERDEQVFIDLENKRRKQTLAESMESYIGAPRTNQMQNNPNIPNQLNEGYLMENVRKMVNEHLIENFGPIVEEAINSSIIEMYAVERIKKVLHENKDLIETVVIETIRKLQAKNKKA